MDDNPITFPDAPRAELDRALSDLVERAREVLQTQGRLRALVKANQAVVSHLELPAVLRAIVTAAVELVGARYGALGVVSPNGGLEQFIHVGMPDHQVEAIGHLPEGHGLLGALIDDPRPIRLTRIADDPRSVGFPAGHPAMDSFLGVPIRVRESVFGNLYLTNNESGAFSQDDEQLARALAGTAGFAIDNARLFAETESRRAWSAAASEITAVLLSGEPEDALAELVQWVAKLSNATLACVVVPDVAANTLRIPHARGDFAEQLTGALRPLSSELIKAAIESGQPRLTDTLDSADLAVDGEEWGPALLIPFQTTHEASSVLILLRRSGAQPFSSFDLERVADLAAQASIAMELATARSDRQRMVLLEDRTRIARDLHDHVIQQLFGAGLELQSIEAALDASELGSRVESTVNVLDDAIRQIRTIIFALSHQSPGVDTVRNRILTLADEIASGLARPASISFSGPVDLVITDGLADDVVAVIREALTNVARHAEAQHVDVSVNVSDGRISVTVVDDGKGMGENARRSGLRNAAERAQLREGSFSIESGEPGTRLNWSVALPQDDGDR